MPTTLIVGGYGAVGSKIARQLSEQPDHHVVVAGRSLSRAQTTASSIGAEARRIDLADPKSWQPALMGVDIAVVCIDQPDTAFIELLGELGIACVDVTAGDRFFQAAERVQTTRPVVLSVGLAPGLSNLLAVSASADMDVIDSIEIGLLMGTGDEHGSAAIAWSTAQMFDPHALRDDAEVDFGPEFGHRHAYFMDFADQHVLRRTLGIRRTITRVTYDSKLLTSALFWIGRQFAGNKVVEKLVQRASHIPTLGSDKCVLSVTAFGSISGKSVSRTSHFFGRREAAVTAAMAVAIVGEVLGGKVAGGVHHAHQVVDPQEVFARIKQWGHGDFVHGPIVPTVRP